MKKILIVILSILLLCALFCGCAAETADDAFWTEPYEMEPQYAETQAEMENGAFYDYSYTGDSSTTANAVETPSSVASNRKLISRVNLSVETENYTELLGEIEARVASCGGYIEYMEANTRYSSSTRYANLTIRVPADRLDSFTGGIAEISNVVYRSESNEDITSTYVDTQSRRDALAVEQARLLELLETAESLSDILEIESRLTQVRYELENMESQLRTYDNLVDYATIQLDVSEVEVYTEVEEKGFWEKIGDGFVNSLESIWTGAKGIFSFLIIALPYLAVFVIVPLAVLFICLRVRKKRRAKRTARSEAEE